MHACVENADLTLCGERVDVETIGESWGFKAVCSVCYPLREFLERPWQAQVIRGRENWPDSSEEIQKLSPEQMDELLNQPEPGPEQAGSSSPDQPEEAS
jgi:hypothetical protein